MTKKSSPGAVEETVNPEHEKLLEVLKFTPRTYKLRVWGYGGEYVMGKVPRKIYDYFKSRRLDFAEFCYNDEYAEEQNIPEEMWPFQPGCWHECDGIIHTNGAAIDAGTLEILDENDTEIYSNELCNITDDDIEIDGGDEAYIHVNVDSNTAVFYGISSEKGLFFETKIELTAPFDKEKLTILFDDIDGTEVMRGAMYDGEDLDCYDMSTNGKGYDMYLYAKSDTGIDSYANMESIDWPMTDWCPKKVKPVREGEYEVHTAGKDSWTRRALWDGSKWISTWNADEEIKIKEWRGIIADPDTLFEAPKNMALWKIEPTFKKSIVERNYFHKDDNTFVVETGWRWGSFTCETEDGLPPKISEGDDLWNCDYTVELEETWDGCWEDHDMDECDEETQEWLETFLEENSYMDLEEHGWVSGDSEMIMNCEPKFECLEGDNVGKVYDSAGEEIKEDSKDEE